MAGIWRGGCEDTTDALDLYEEGQVFQGMSCAKGWLRYLRLTLSLGKMLVGIK